MPPSNDDEWLAAQIERLAPSRVTVLLLGGTPAARAAVARALHDRSGRCDEPFVALDCTALSGEELERRLFGGPMTEPAARGLVHQMARGTLYVAAVDALPVLLQPRFLSFLERDRKVRVVTSARLDLGGLVRDGRFRSDLGERLLVVQLVLPNG
jgi:DNA-binding NtrC family response regulator